jgi:beta-glucosidase
VAFGEGLSYTTFRYSDLELSDPNPRDEEAVVAQVKVTNTGGRAGAAAVLWFLTDEVGSITRPVRQLKHFEKRTLAAGEMAVMRFRIEPKRHLGFPDAQGSPVLEDGTFALTVGDQKIRFNYARSRTPMLSTEGGGSHPSASARVQE